MKYIIVFFIGFYSTLLSQIDPERWYPLDDGNYWEYYTIDANNPPNYKQYHFRKVVGDTIINSRTYKVVYIENFDGVFKFGGYSFFREEGNRIYMLWQGHVYLGHCNNTEILLYDCTDLPDNTLWSICSVNENKIACVSFVSNYALYSPIFNGYLQNKLFVSCKVEKNDTTIIPYDLITVAAHSYISKGIGLYEFQFVEGGIYKLQGGVINGVQFGTIVGIQESKDTVVNPDKINFAVYPNPFNSTTTLQFHISDNGVTIISLYTMYGEKIKTIRKDYQTIGQKTESLDLSSYASGIYLVVLQTSNQKTTKKLILLK